MKSILSSLLVVMLSALFTQAAMVSANLTMTGNMVATGSVVIPEPTGSLFLAGLACSVGLARRRRRA